MTTESKKKKKKKKQQQQTNKTERANLSSIPGQTTSRKHAYIVLTP